MPWLVTRVLRRIRGLPAVSQREHLEQIEELAAAVHDASVRADLVLQSRRNVGSFLAMLLVLVELALASAAAIAYHYRGIAVLVSVGEYASWIGAAVSLDSEFSLLAIASLMWPVVYFVFIRSVLQRYFQFRINRTRASRQERVQDLTQRITEFERTFEFDYMCRVLRTGKSVAASALQAERQEQGANVVAKQGTPVAGAAASSAGRTKREPKTGPVAAVGTPGTNASASAATQRSVATSASVPATPAHGTAAPVVVSGQPVTPVDGVRGGGDLRKRILTSNVSAAHAHAAPATPHLPNQQGPSPRYTARIPEDVLRAQRRGAATEALTPPRTTKASADQSGAARSPFTWLLDAIVGEAPTVPVTCSFCNQVSSHQPGDGRHLLAFTCRHCHKLNPRRSAATLVNATRVAAVADADNNNNNNDHAVEQHNEDPAVDGEDNEAARAEATTEAEAPVESEAPKSSKSSKSGSTSSKEGRGAKSPKRD